LIENETVEKLNAQLNSTYMKRNLEMFSSFNNRFFQSGTGNTSAEWLLARVHGYITEQSPVTVSVFQHAYRQNSIIATIPGKSAKTIVVGAHQDTINVEAVEYWMTDAAPEAGGSCSSSREQLKERLTRIRRRWLRKHDNPRSLPHAVAQ
jgi:leucyl aminopeptidase